MYEFTVPTKEDAIYIAENLKQNNRREVLAAIGDNCLIDILRSMEASDMLGCLKYNGKPLAIYGVIPDSIMGGTGIAWLLFTAEIVNHRRVVGRYTKRGLREIMAKYMRVYNWVDAGNIDIIRWLKWLGAKFKGPYKRGIYGIEHYYFYFERGGE